jgi:hypothetical protein
MNERTKDFIFDTFIKLTSKTVPYGSEDIFVESIFSKLIPKNKLNKDKNGNYFVKVGESNTIFASHLDTVSKEYTQVSHVIEKNIIKTDGKTTLGADDKAGVTIMLYMIINNVPGLYYFFIGEEVGCIGSGLASRDLNFKHYNKIISFDRYGTNSVITHQSSQRTSSDLFTNSLCNELNLYGFEFEPDSGGVYTDSAEFMSIIPECTNISVGYYKQHTVNEYQDIDFLTKLSDACLLINWDNIPIERDPTKVEYKNSYFPAINDYIIDYDEHYMSKRRNRRSRKNKSKNIYFDSGGELVEINSNKNKFDFSSLKKEKYEWIIDKYVNQHFTWGDLQTIRECYLDMDNDYDSTFYEYLKEQIVDF